MGLNLLMRLEIQTTKTNQMEFFGTHSLSAHYDARSTISILIQSRLCADGASHQTSPGLHAFSLSASISYSLG